MITIQGILNNNVLTPSRQLTSAERKTVTSKKIDGENYIYFQGDEPEPITVNDPILAEKLKYDQRCADGQHAYLMLMAELRLNSIENELPREVNKDIEERLENVRQQVVSGQWISALEKLQAVQVGGYLTQELYDRIEATITNYIQANY